MKVGYLVNQYPKTSHTFIRREIRALESMGVEVVRFSVRRTTEELPDLEDRKELLATRVLLEGMPEQFMQAGLRALLSPAQLGRSLSLAARTARASERPLVHAAYLAEALRLREECRNDGVDHLHVHFGTNSATVALLCRALGGPTFSMTVHGPEEFDRPHALMLPLKIELARFVVGVSSFGRSQLWRYTSPETWSKVHVVRCGVDEEFLEEPAEPVPDVASLVCVARFGEQKGHFVLFDALAQLKDEHPSARVVLIGDGELRPVLEARARALGIEHRLGFVGWADGETVRSTIDATRGFILPSFAEGLPVVLMEAMARARPVLTTYIAGIPELVEDGRSGWLVPAGNATRLADGLRRILEAPVEQLSEMGMVGRERVREQHSATENAKLLKELFETSP
ncbi:MAG: glycosyltransferase family 4 protein [Myxococcales bacterium]|nr:glycosyltransferase family 4 protein [Myxococcales bacterium]